MLRHRSKDSNISLIVLEVSITDQMPLQLRTLSEPKPKILPFTVSIRLPLVDETNTNLLRGHLRLLMPPGSMLCINHIQKFRQWLGDTYICQQAEAWWRASIWRSHRKVVIKQCSYHNNIIDIQNRLPYSKVVYPAIIVLFSWLMEVNHGVRTGPDYPFR